MDTPRRVIDSHAHVWSEDIARYPRRRNASPSPPALSATVDSLLAAMDEANVERAVLVQPSIYGNDHSYLRDAIAVAPQRFAAVALIDPFAANGAELLAQLADTLPLRGIRLHLKGLAAREAVESPRTGQLLRAATDRGLTLSVLTDPSGLQDIDRLAGRHPALDVVVDHLGSPARGGLAGPTYHRALERLGQTENVHLKISGFYSFSTQPYPHADCQPLVHFVLDSFGPARLVWGSDFPYVRMACSYARCREQLDVLLASRCSTELSPILYDNAETLWW